MPTSETFPPDMAQPDYAAQAPLPMSQTALDAMPFPLSIFTREGLTVAANDLSGQLFRVPRSAVIGRFNILSQESILDQQGRDLFLAAVEGQQGHAPPSYYHFSFPGTQHAERQSCWIETSYLPFRDDSGRVTHVGVMTHDITDRVDAEQRSAMLSTLVENARDAIGVTDAAGRVIFSNPAFKQLTGYGDTLEGMAITEIHPDDAAIVLDAAAQVMGQGHWSGQLDVRHADSSRIPVEISAFMLRDSQGTPSGMGAILRNISERHAQEKRLRTFEALVENAAVGMAVTDLEGTYTYANAALRETYGYGAAIVGMRIPQLLTADQQEIAAQRMAELFTHGRMSTEAKFICRDGSIRPISVAALLIRAADGTPIATAAVIRDLTEDHAREQERTALQEQVISAQQAAIRELSTPLIPIASGVVAMPLIGTIDTNRARLVIETLLSGVSELRAHTTILDITGVPIVDTQVANALLQAAQAVKLLGARVILTGIRPEVAQTLVGLGVDLSGIVTRGTLQSGIADALERVPMAQR
jgi:rsbT co-antagonist protein RsbR